MRPTIRWIAALLMPTLVLTGTLVAQKKIDKDLEKSTDKMVKAGVVVGKVTAVYEDKKMVRVSVGIPKLSVSAYQGLQRAQYNLAMARTPQAYQAAQAALLQAQRTPLYTMENKDIELKAADDVVVRMLKPKEDFDEKGKPKKYTKKEKAEMRGPDKKLPGYKAEFGDISTDQLIQITLVRKKGAPALPRHSRKKKKDEGAEADLLADYAPMASLIVIIREPAPPPK